MIRSTREGWAGYVAACWKSGMYTGFWRSQKKRDRFEDIDIGGKIILKWILERQDGAVWTESIWLMTGTSGALL
jgi:hypothetical protein